MESTTTLALRGHADLGQRILAIGEGLLVLLGLLLLGEGLRGGP